MTASTAALAAQARMHRLLDEKFDADRGCYSHGWDDNRVAAQTGMCAELVRQYRKAAFGAIRPPGELEVLGREIASLEQRINDANTAFRAEWEALAGRVAAFGRNFQD